MFLPLGSDHCGLLSLTVWQQSLSSNLRIPVSPEIGSVRRAAASYRTGGEWQGKSGSVDGQGRKGATVLPPPVKSATCWWHGLDLAYHWLQ